MKRTPLSRDTSPEAVARARAKHAAAVRRYQERARERGRKPLPAVNRARKAKRAAEGEVYGPYHRWVSTLPCAVLSMDCWGPVNGHHLKHVGAGGKDAVNEVPLCAYHHTEVHASPERFEMRHRVDLETIALDLWARHGMEGE